MGGTTSFTLVVSNGGPSTLTGSINDVIPAQLTTTLAGIASQVNGSASTANFSLTGATFAGSVTIASGGTVTVTIQVTGVTTGSYTNTLNVLVPAGTTNTGSNDGHGLGHGHQRGQHRADQGGGSAPPSRWAAPPASPWW